jgi:lipopolysaccharide/colanic/teichoic acid biosynthesis glycosyltransferase
MVPDAAEQLRRHLERDPEAAAEWAATRKLSQDPRITRLGDMLRRTSLDELPQLWNVLRGEMSFVGPRPVPEDELQMYGAARSAYCAMRPGITGLWQISGRNDISYAERVKLDTEYLRRMSPGLDLSIILRTALVVFRPTGR